MNVYAYVRSQPINRFDPDGRFDWDAFGEGLVAGAAAVVVGVVVVAAVASGVGAVALALGASAAVAEGLATGVVVGAAVVGAAQTGVKIGEVATGETVGGEELSDSERSRMAGEATAEVVAIAVGGARAKARSSARARAKTEATEQIIQDRAMLPEGQEGRTLSTGRSGGEKTPTRVSEPQGEHAEPQTLRDLAPKAGGAKEGQVVAVDQVPCENCAPALAEQLPPGSEVVVPKRVGGKPPAPPGEPKVPGTSPKQAAKRAAAGEVAVEPHTVMRVPRSPAQVGRDAPPPAGLLSPGPEDDLNKKSPPPTPPPGSAQQQSSGWWFTVFKW